jgi:ubiquinone/menaquinone biosynthesis C-methylase UbiE
VTQDRMTTLSFEIMSGLPRQGAGDATCTRHALEAVPNVGPQTRLLDIGCGTGSQTRALLEHSLARVLAIDNYPPFVEELNRQAQRLGLADRLEARVADMRELDFPPASFDVVWCEGAIYNVGFERGLREWRRLLVPGGHMAVTEVCWTTSDPPQECVEFWNQEYPSIRTVPVLLHAIDTCGYDCIAQFPMPQSAWWDDYYHPLQQNVAAFRERHRHEADAQQVADGVQREIDVWGKYGEFYAYEFFVMRAR